MEKERNKVESNMEGEKERKTQTEKRKRTQKGKRKVKKQFGKSFRNDIFCSCSNSSETTLTLGHNPSL